MGRAFDIIDLFLANPNKSFSKYDVMKSLRISWVTANDNLLNLYRVGLVKKDDEGLFCLDENMLSLVRKIT